MEPNLDSTIHNLLSEKGEVRCIFDDKSQYLQFPNGNLFVYGIRNPDGSGSTNVEYKGLVYMGKTKDGLNFQEDRYKRGEWEKTILELMSKELVANVPVNP